MSTCTTTPWQPPSSPTQTTASGFLMMPPPICCDTPSSPFCKAHTLLGALVECHHGGSHHAWSQNPLEAILTVLENELYKHTLHWL